MTSINNKEQSQNAAAPFCFINLSLNRFDVFRDQVDGVVGILFAFFVVREKHHLRAAFDVGLDLADDVFVLLFAVLLPKDADLL
jgi:hypothetical protein